MARLETFTYQYRKNKIKLLQRVHAVETEDETEKNGVRQIIRLYYKLKDISRETRLKYQWKQKKKKGRGLKANTDR